jgi:transcriptional regulator with XRE-family HTH domain
LDYIGNAISCQVLFWIGDGKFLAGFSERLRELRRNKKLTQEELGVQVLKVSGRMVRYYEQGKIMPELEGVISLADFFGVSVDYLLGRSDAK